LDAQAYSCWIEVDLSALETNLRTIENHSQVPLLPVLKGDAYGHGAPIVAAFLKSRGYSLLAVSSLEEALEILAVVPLSLLVLTPPLPSQLALFLQHHLIPTITSLDQLAVLASLAQRRGQKVTIHLKVDTGFGRLGLAPDDLLPLIEKLPDMPSITLGGVLTHFPAALKERKFTIDQLSLFLALREKVRSLGDYGHVLWHGANSSAFLTLPASHLDLVRIGTLLYGQSPLPGQPPWSLATTWQFKTRLVQIRTLPKGHSVGYGRLYRTKRPTRMGVIPVGYSHGLELEPLSTPWRQIKQALGQELRGKHFIFHPLGPLPILGRVGMGLTSVDLSNIPQAKVGDSVTVSMRRVTASKHAPRIYYLGGVIKCMAWNNHILNSQGRAISPRSLF
jgi:alanine racemase